jgi:acetyl-CoA carboxylase biotin carboxyl carrier protein
MELSYDDVANILKIIDASALEEVAIELGDFTLVIRKRPPKAADGAVPPPPAAEEEEYELKAPAVGTFRLGDQQPIGAGVDLGPDDVVAVIDVLGVSNPIRLGRRGRVLQVLVMDGQVVEYGQPLMIVRTA